MCPNCQPLPSRVSNCIRMMTNRICPSPTVVDCTSAFYSPPTIMKCFCFRAACSCQESPGTRLLPPHPCTPPSSASTSSAQKSRRYCIKTLKLPSSMKQYTNFMLAHCPSTPKPVMAIRELDNFIVLRSPCLVKKNSVPMKRITFNK